MCLVCTLVEEHGGSKSCELVRVDFFQIDEPVTLGYLQRWRDKNGHVWWLSMLGELGWTPAPITDTTRAQSFRHVRGRVVIPLFASQGDAEHALRSSYGLAVDA